MDVSPEMVDYIILLSGGVSYFIYLCQPEIIVGTYCNIISSIKICYYSLALTMLRLSLLELGKCDVHFALKYKLLNSTA